MFSVVNLGRMRPRHWCHVEDRCTALKATVFSREHRNGTHQVEAAGKEAMAIPREPMDFSTARFKFIRRRTPQRPHCFSAFARDGVTHYRYDFDRDGADEWVLENAGLRLIVSPESAGKLSRWLTSLREQSFNKRGIAAGFFFSCRKSVGPASTGLMAAMDYSTVPTRPSGNPKNDPP